jgi:hypothetical protein
MILIKSQQTLTVIGCCVGLLYFFLADVARQYTAGLDAAIASEFDIGLYVVSDHQALLFLDFMDLDKMVEDEGVWLTYNVSFHAGCCL